MADELRKEGADAPARDPEPAADRRDALSGEETRVPSRKAPDWLGEHGEISRALNRQATGNGAKADRHSAAARRALIATNQRSSDGGRRSPAARAVEVAGLEPFAVEVQWRDDVAIVAPRGDLDLATVESLRAALDSVKGAGRLVLDLGGLSFIDSTGLHLLVALNQRAQRDGFELALLAPAARVARAIKLCGLDQALPFVTPVDTVDSEPGESASGPVPGSSRQT
jgi:anti-sigma B factor antagonist